MIHWVQQTKKNILIPLQIANKIINWLVVILLEDVQTVSLEAAAGGKDTCLSNAKIIMKLYTTPYSPILYLIIAITK